MNTDVRSKALLVIDVQYDFLPGGALAVTDGDAIIKPVSDLMRSDAFGIIVATQDWHPAGHISFASSHIGCKPFDSVSLYGKPQMLWPDHCVAGSHGAELHASLPMHNVRAVIRKGCDASVDSYSAFRNNFDPDGRRPATGLAGFLRECGITDLWVCGLARDFCVFWSAIDAADLGFRTRFLWDLTRPVNAADDDKIRTALNAAAVEIVV